MNNKLWFNLLEFDGFEMFILSEVQSSLAQNGLMNKSVIQGQDLAS